MKKNMLFIVLMVLCLCALAGCGISSGARSAITSGDGSKKSDGDEKGKINIDEISYEARSEIKNGDRYVMLSLTNNSDYTLTEFEVKYRVKPDVTEEQKKSFYKDVADYMELSSDKLKELEESDISMHAETGKSVDPGVTIDRISCHYFNGYYYLKNMDHFNLVEPDIVTIKYIYGDTIYTVYYDYENKSYSYDSGTEKADEWTTGTYGDKIPKPDAKHISSSRDDEDLFMFKAYGFSLNEFDDYVDQCKKKGYTENPNSFDGFYTADSNDGYNVRLNYDENDGSITGIIKKSGDEEQQ